MNRVVITGYSCVTATGDNITDTWQAVKKGEVGIAPMTQWDVDGWQYPLGAEVKNYNPRQMVPDRKLLKVISRHDVIGIHAVTQAMAHSGLVEYRDTLTDPTDFNDRTGLVVGSPGVKFSQQYAFMPLMSKAQDDLKIFGKHLLEDVHPMWLLRILPNNVIAYASILNGFKGANENFTNHVVGGLQALGEAWNLVKAGVIDRAIVIGYDSGLIPQALAYYGGIGLLSANGVKPFAKDRDGCVLGEGAGVMILETEASAQQRNATIYGEVLGGTTCGEAQGVLSICDDGQGVRRALQKTLELSGQSPEQIGLITAHANATELSDKTEAMAIGQVFGGHQVPVTGFKWSIGHTLAGAGVIESILTLLSLREGQAPGIASLGEVAADCANLQVSSKPQSCQSDVGMVISRGFASLTACCAIRAIS